MGDMVVFYSARLIGFGVTRRSIAWNCTLSYQTPNQSGEIGAIVVQFRGSRNGGRATAGGRVRIPLLDVPRPRDYKPCTTERPSLRCTRSDGRSSAGLASVDQHENRRDTVESCMRIATGYGSSARSRGRCGHLFYGSSEGWIVSAELRFNVECASVPPAIKMAN